MVQMSRQDSPVVYDVFDGERPIGRVVAPAGEPALRLGAGTVLLRRDAGVAEAGAA
ncbi:MAG: hypothetical protein M3Q93_01985 [Gemmatimonadota bacterium]|nr:hypothetical protein [Gemmatimonadota bacterium]